MRAGNTGEDIMRNAGIWLSAATATLLFSSHTRADEATSTAKEHFDIGSQPLAQALRLYALQTGEQVVFFSDVGRGRDSTNVSGQYTRDEALRKILQDTGLTYQRLNTKTIAISPPKADTTKAIREDSQSSTADHMMQPIRLAQAETAAGQPQQQTAAAADEQTTEDESLFSMTEVVVTGTASAERTKYESSVAISTFDQDDIAQQAPQSTADLISAVPGFWVESTAGTTQGNVFARGIIQDGGYRYVGLMEDGIPIYPVFELSFYNPDQFVRVDETVTRVEALRGGTAPIFTPGAVGGAINFVTESPGKEPAGRAKGTIGDYGFYQADLVWSGPIAEDWGLLVGGYYRQSEGIRDPGYDADEGGQIRFKVTRTLEQGNFEIFGKYINDRSLFVVPIPLQGNADDPDGINGADPGEYSVHSEDLARAGLPPSAAAVGLQGSDLRDGIHPDLWTAGGRINWNLNDAVTLTNLLRYTDGEVRFDGIFTGEAPVTGAAFAADRGVAPAFTQINNGAAYAASQLVQNHGHWAINKEFQAFQDDVRLNFSVMEVHDLAVGAYFADYSMEDRWSLGNNLLMDVSNRPNRLFLPGVTDPNGFTLYANTSLLTDWDAQTWSLYASDEWRVTDQLRLDFGVRYDDQDIEGSVRDTITVNLDGNPATPWDNETVLPGPTSSPADASFDNFGWSAGFNFEFTQQHAMFGHYTDSAKLPHFDDIRGGSRRKDRVQNVELGYKTSLQQVALFATLFQTEFDNVFFNDILADGSQARRSAKTSTRGIELEGIYQPMDILSIGFSITQQDPEYRDFLVTNAQTGVVSDLDGNRIRRIPKTMVRLTPTLGFSEGRGRVFLTYTHVGDRPSNDENTIELPKYDKLDAGVLFDITPSMTVQLRGDNLTDEVGLTEGNPRTDVGAGGIGTLYNARPLFGRSFQGSFTVRF
jgi:iron complex outermembrane recepter protein